MATTTQAINDAQPAVRQPNLLSWEASSAAFTQVGATFDAAWRAFPNERVEAFYQLAGKTIHLRVVGRALAALYQRAYAPRISHAIATVPALTIDLWDEEVTGLTYPLPLLPLGEDDGNQRYLGDRQVQFGDESGRWVWGEKPGTATWLDRKANRIIGWRAQGAQLPTHERSKPLSFLLPIWFYDQGIHILHAGMVARNGAGVLVAGGSGIGKTTTTLCCVLAGLSYLSDDQVAVTRAGHDGQGDASGRFVAHSVFQSARVLPDHLQRFPALHAGATFSHDPLDPKALLFLAELFPNQVTACATINAIALPRLAGQAQTHFRRATRVDALNYMARTSLVTALGIGRARFENLTRLLGSAPCYWLDLGHDLTRIPNAVDLLLAENL